MPGFRRKRELINHPENIIPSPFPTAPVKVIRQKPIHGILTTRKHKLGNSPEIHRIPHPAIFQCCDSPSTRPPSGGSHFKTKSNHQHAIKINQNPSDLTKKRLDWYSLPFQPYFAIPKSFPASPHHQTALVRLFPTLSHSISDSRQCKRARPKQQKQAYSLLYWLNPAAISRQPDPNLSSDKNFQS